MKDKKIHNEKAIKARFSELIQAKTSKKINKFKKNKIPGDHMQRDKFFKKRKFDLNSDDENDLQMTHNGISINNMDDFNEFIENDSEDEKIPTEIVENFHFGGFENQENPSAPQKKSKQEIYKEIIKKSKKMKYEKQKLKEENLDKAQEINNNENLLSKLMSLKRKKEQKNYKQTFDDDYEKMFKEMSADTKVYAELIQSKDSKKKNRRNRNDAENEEEKIFSSELDEQSDIVNDDEIEEKINRAKRGVGYEVNKLNKKQTKLNKFLDDLKTIKRNKKIQEELGSSSDSEDDDDSEEDDLEDEEENDEEQSLNDNNESEDEEN